MVSKNKNPTLRMWGINQRMKTIAWLAFGRDLELIFAGGLGGRQPPSTNHLPHLYCPISAALKDAGLRLEKKVKEAHGLGVAAKRRGQSAIGIDHCVLHFHKVRYVTILVFQRGCSALGNTWHADHS